MNCFAATPLLCGLKSNVSRAGLLLAFLSAQGATAQVQQIVFDSPATAVGAAPYLGNGSPVLGPGGTLSFHLTQNAIIKSVSFDVTAAGVQELTVSRYEGCQGSGYTGVVAAGSVCSVDYFLTPIFTGLRERSGTLRVVTEAGSYTAGVAFTVSGPQMVFTPGTVSSVKLDPAEQASAFALDGMGNRYIASAAANVVEKIDARTGEVSLIAGNGSATAGGDGGAATAAGMPNPVSIAVAPSGDVYVIADDAAAYYEAVRKIDAKTGLISTLYTFESYGLHGAVTADRDGFVYVGVPYNGDLLRVSQTGSVTALACYSPGQPARALAPTALPSPPPRPIRPTSIALDGNGHIYFISNNGGASDVYVTALPPADCFQNFTLVATGFSGASGLAVDAAGNVYVSDTGANRVAKIAAGAGTVTTVAGGGTAGSAGDGGPETSAELQGAGSVALDALGNLYVLVTTGNVVRVIDRHDAALSFPETALNVTSAPESVTLENVGSMDLTLSSAVTGTNPAIFGSFILGTGGTCPNLPGAGTPTLAVGASCKQELNFLPTRAGGITGMLTFVDNAGGSALGQLAQTVFLSGSGAASQGLVLSSPSSADFGSVPAGSVSQSWSLNVSNTSGAATKISAILLSDPYDFKETTNCGSLLAAYSSCQVLVSFAPTKIGYLTSTLEVDGDAAPYQQTIPLTGIGQVAAGSYTVHVNPSALSLKAGETGTAAFAFAPFGGFTGAVTFACAGLPNGAACSFAPATLTADGSNKVQVSQMTVTTSGMYATHARSEQGTHSGVVTTLFGLNGLLVGLVFVRQRARPAKKALALALLLGGLGAVSGCGSGILSGSTSAVSQTVTVMATAAATTPGANLRTATPTTQTASFLLTVTQ